MLAAHMAILFNLTWRWPRWDTRKLSEPSDTVLLCTDIKGEGQVLGGSSLEYNSEVRGLLRSTSPEVNAFPGSEQVPRRHRAGRGPHDKLEESKAEQRHYGV
jgi:hypothetical protein